MSDYREKERREQDIGPMITIGRDGTPIELKTPVIKETFVREGGMFGTQREFVEAPLGIKLVQESLQAMLSGLPISVRAPSDTRMDISITQSKTPLDRDVADGHYHLEIVMEGRGITTIPPSQLPTLGYEFIYDQVMLPTGEIDRFGDPIKRSYMRTYLGNRDGAGSGDRLPVIGTQPGRSTPRRITSVTVYTPM